MVTLRGNQTWLEDAGGSAPINGHFRYLQWTYQNWRRQKKDLRKGYMCRYPPNRPLNPTVPPVEVLYMAIGPLILMEVI